MRSLHHSYATAHGLPGGFIPSKAFADIDSRADGAGKSMRQGDWRTVKAVSQHAHLTVVQSLNSEAERKAR